MNILPKKRWHVRTKENIARVRKDEAEAAENEKHERIRIENADREARLNFLKDKSKEKLHKSGVTIDKKTYDEESKEHINFFSDLEHTTKSINKDHDKEAKTKKEEYEKQIGYLTYLGQDTNEALGKKNWYEVLPESSRYSRSNEIKDTYNKLILRDSDGKTKINDSDIKDGEIEWKMKQRLDPLNSFREFLPKKLTSEIDKNKLTNNSHITKMKAKNLKDKVKNKYCNDKHNKNEKIQKLREERLKRELKEKEKTKLFLAGLNGLPSSAACKIQTPVVIPKYNSQFNPKLARQNFYQ
ncbi:Leukocyte receptor cluster member 1 [Eumeta japonica]|uniref:Leukocyte receptor cluster member 1 n=1 Tax=Eumeta variegata TaxID=151549 RepID=A0A4C1V9D1_EUMVA|nr:Leukocyte receptor cluster member 1 [Eumeta japonica]